MHFRTERVKEIVAGNDVFVALPTGYGKSLCYALLPTVFDFVRGRPPNSSIVLCVSPLISLMVDQKEQYSKRGLAVDFVGSGEERERIANGQCQLVCISPEALLCNLYWREVLRKFNLAKKLGCISSG